MSNQNKTVKHMTEEDMSPIQLQRHYKAKLRKEVGDIRRCRKVQLKEDLVDIEVKYLTSMSSDTSQAAVELQNLLTQRKLEEPQLLQAQIQEHEEKHKIQFNDALMKKLGYANVVGKAEVNAEMSEEETQE